MRLLHLAYPALLNSSADPPPADVKHPEGPQAPPSVPFMTAGPSHIPHAGPSQPTVYYYMDPQTGNQIASLLPPDHPEMVCLREGQHVTKTSFGLLGASPSCTLASPSDILCRHHRRRPLVPSWCGLVLGGPAYYLHPLRNCSAQRCLQLSGGSHSPFSSPSRSWS